MAGVSEYERLRQERMARNQAKLAELGVQELRDSAAVLAHTPSPGAGNVANPSKKRARAFRPVSAEEVPRRVSLRTRGLPPTQQALGPADLEQLEKEVAAGGKSLKGAAHAHGFSQGGERHLLTRVADIDMRSMNASAREDKCLVQLLSSLELPGLGSPRNAREQPVQSSIDGLKNGTSPLAEVAAARDGTTETAEGGQATLDARALQLQPNHFAKVTKERIHSILFLPTRERVLLAAGDKSGQLALWNVDPHPSDYACTDGNEVAKPGVDNEEQGSGPGQDDDEGSGIHTFQIHDSVVSGLALPTWDPCSASLLYTCSYDGSVRAMDLKAQAFRLLIAPQADDELAFSEVTAVPCLPQCLLLGTDQGELLLCDTRLSEASSGTGAEAGQTGRRRGIVGQWQAHERKISSISAMPAVGPSPAGGHCVVTASNDNSVALWDLRKVAASRWLMPAQGEPTKVSKQGHISSPHNLARGMHARSVTAAYFSPDGSKIVSTSYDNTIRIWSPSPPGKPTDLDEAAVIKHNNNTGRWIASFRAVWAWDSRHVVVGGMGRSLDVIDSEGKGRVVASLQHPEYMTTIPARCAAHPSRSFFAGGSASGRIFLWAPGKMNL